MKLPLFVGLCFLLVQSVQAEIQLPRLFSNHMVLQRGNEVPVWGTAEPGEMITVRFGTVKAEVIADKQGKWLAKLPALTGGTIQDLEVSGSQSKKAVTFSDVAVGEVWICSGQSNMEWPVPHASEGNEEVAAANHPGIRLFRVPTTAAEKPASDVHGTWQVCSPLSAAGFSAVGYFFGKKLHEELKVPIGLIQSAVGNTPAEAWTPLSSLKDNPLYESLVDARQNAVKVSSDDLGSLVERIEAAWKIKVDPLFEKPTKPDPAWFNSTIPLPEWKPVNIPGAVDTQLGLETEGSFWVRKTFMVNEAEAAGNATLFLGKVDDFDFTWVNGHPVGQMGRDDPQAWSTNREYPLPSGTLLAGENVLLVRVIDHYREGGFNSSPSVLRIETAAGTSIPLAGIWQAKLETDIGKKPPIPSNDWTQLAGTLFDGMIAPLAPFGVRGVIWYQGENNVGRAKQYRQLFPLLIESWRKAWGAPLSFYFVQLANFQERTNEPAESDWAELREAQAVALALPKTGMAVAIDVGEAGDIHPRNKKDSGERLAAIALAKDYGKKSPFSGPVFESAKLEGGKMRVKFSQTGDGLVPRPLPATYDINSKDGETAPLVRNSPGSELEGFALCGADKQWFWADAKIDGQDVLVWSDKVTSPVSLRYAWANNPVCNLYNTAGFPASPFRTDKPNP